MKEYEKILKALANKRRLEIVKFLKQKGEATVSEIAAHLKLSLKATSKHLGQLFAADILEREQRSLLAFYSITAKLSPMSKAVILLL